jgi:hypothetical protein
MASLYKEKTRTGAEVYIIRFTLIGCRKKIHLGDVPKKQAELVKSKVEKLVNSRLTNTSCFQETARWLGGINDKLHEKLSVAGPKTERKGKDKRIVPIFEQLYPYISDAFEAAPEGEDRLFPEIRENRSMGSWVRSLADRAGIVLWEKPFQNMRATCATDLVDSYPGHVCEAWLGHTELGHTERVADQYDRQVTESHFERATGRKHTENKRALKTIPLT